MPTTDESPDSARASALAAWLREQPIAVRTRAALLRDLDRVGAGPDGGTATSQLVGLDHAAFTLQLHKRGGGCIAHVPGIGARALAGLRRAIPLPAHSQPSRRTEAEAVALLTAPSAPVTLAEPTAGPGGVPLIENPPAAGLALAGIDGQPGPSDSTGAAHTGASGAPDDLDTTLRDASKVPDPPDDTGAALVAAAAGLLMPSESDSPFTRFWMEGPALPLPAALLAQLKLPPSTPVETRTLDEFFAPLTRVADWMDASQRAQAARFAELRNQIVARLRDVVVYRFGRIRITVLIVGQGAGEQIVGLSTTLVET